MSAFWNVHARAVHYDPLTFVLAWILAGLIFLTGAAAVALSLPGLPLSTWETPPVEPGVTLVVASLAGSIALATAETWRRKRNEQMALELRGQRARVYEDLLTEVIGSFRAVTTHSPVPCPAPSRAKVALWASAETAAAFETWFTMTGRFVRQGRTSLHDHEKPIAFDAVWGIVRATRDDLRAQGDLDKETTLRMIFASYDEDMAAATKSPAADRE